MYTNIRFEASTMRLNYYITFREKSQWEFSGIYGNEFSVIMTEQAFLRVIHRLKQAVQCVIPESLEAHFLS